ncbi:MAG: hypothetical protein JRH20_00925 [Deltaproteobacteria bacterium]|nr:hypothetical protein [Deltaproteobacteria bacterium]
MVCTQTFATLSLTLALTLGACATGGNLNNPTLPPTAIKTHVETKHEAEEADRPRALKSTQNTKGPAWDARLLAAIPHQAIGVVALGPEFGLRALRGLVNEIPELKKELSTFLHKALGIDLVSQQQGGLAVFVTALQPQPEFCLRLSLQGASGRALRGPLAGQHQGIPLIALDGKVVAALVDDALLVGSRRAVTSVIDQRQSSTPSPLAAKLQALAGQKPVLAGSVNLLAFGQAAAAFGMRHAAVTVSKHYEVTLQVEGDPTLMGRVPPLYAMGTGAVITRMLHQKTMAKRGSDVAKGAIAIAAYHLAKKVIEEATPRLDDESGTLTSRFKVPMMDVGGLPMVGVLAAVAIPAFIKYLRKSKSMEAREGIQQLQRGAQTLFATRGGARKLARLKSTPWTPAQSSCQRRAKSSAGLVTFKTPTFQALGFAPTPPYRYQYRVLRTGRGKALVLTLEARGDLDCDNTPSSFKLIGAVKNKALVFSGPMISAELE